MSVRKGILGIVATLSAASFLQWPSPATELPPNLSALKNPAPQARTSTAKPAARPEARRSPVQSLAEKPGMQNVYQGKAHQAVYQAELAQEDLAQPESLTSAVDMLRSIPLEIKDYPAVRNLPTRFSTANQVLQAIDSTPTLLVHMEVLRRGYHQLEPSEKDKLLTSLLERHRASEHDLMLGFDHGYAQLVFKRNKTGLFFLRKANDRFKNQFSSLAYGMAQVEADITLENATPEEMTTRKMDAMYKLADAVQYDSQSHQPGFWPSYVRVIEKMKPLQAYSSFTHRDFSLVYLPYGNSVIPMQGATTASIPLKSSYAGPSELGLGGACDPSLAADSDAVSGSLVSQRSMNFGAGSALIQFFGTNEPGLYRVRVSSSDGQPLLSFKTYARNSIVEDLDGDGNFEIVARQYSQDPLNPVLVYRHTPCGFELDKKITDNFL
jgi:hypothetical protein